MWFKFELLLILLENTPKVHPKSTGMKMNRYLGWNLWMSLRYRLVLHRYRVLPTGTLCSSMGYFKRKISLFSSEVMYRWDGKKGTREARDLEFESRPTIFDKNTTKESLRHQFFYLVLMTMAKDPGFGVPVQFEPVPKALVDRYLRCLF